ncbi:MAG: hypothetical protein EAZ54_07760 [Curvibacter sp.]|nr:MAG: hypothetical protein EAZ54_07760 [Curvibacter sp.]
MAGGANERPCAQGDTHRSLHCRRPGDLPGQADQPDARLARPTDAQEAPFHTQRLLELQHGVHRRVGPVKPVHRPAHGHGCPVLQVVRACHLPVQERIAGPHAFKVQRRQQLYLAAQISQSAVG